VSTTKTRRPATGSGAFTLIALLIRRRRGGHRHTTPAADTLRLVGHTTSTDVTVL
jgi:hypothetical protein